MSDDSSRRYTDQEVGLVLRRAAELEERRATTSARGLTLAELHDIARDVGLSPAVIDEALHDLERRGAATRSGEWLGGPTSTKLARGVAGTLDEAALRRLLRVVEDRVDATGTVTEALGTVRWTSTPRGDHFEPSIQVSLGAAGGETQIHVVHRYPSRVRTLTHVLPTMWGGMLGGVVAMAAVSSVGAALAVGVASMAAGFGIGRAVWQTLAGRGARRAEALATDLESEAKRLASDADPARPPATSG